MNPYAYEFLGQASLQYPRLTIFRPQTIVRSSHDRRTFTSLSVDMTPHTSQVTWSSPSTMTVWIRVYFFFVYFCFCWREFFLNTKFVHGLPLPPSFHPEFLSAGVQGMRLPWVLALRGIRRGGSWDTIRWLRMPLCGAWVSPGMRAHPSISRVLTSLGTWTGSEQ